MVATSRGLGRGLSALIPEGLAPPDARVPVTEVDIDRVVPNPLQPRLTLDPAGLAELTDSIREHGVIQPLLVSQEPGPDGAPTYQLIAGERRWRAARAAGLRAVPVTIRQVTPRELLELAIIENVQRADLSPLEEALAYQRLMREFGLTQQDIASRVHRSRAAVANTVRLASLPEELRASLASGEISEGHARAMLPLDNAAMQVELWRVVVERSLNVRQTERLVAETLKQAVPSESALPPPPPPERLALIESLQRSLGTKVTMKRARRGAGSLTIHFYSDEELEGLLDRLGVTAR